MAGFDLIIVGRFWVFTEAISEFGKVDRIFSEMLGLGIAFATGGLGYILKTKADDLGAQQDPPINEWSREQAQ